MIRRGDRFGPFTIVCETDRDEWNRRRYTVKCNCGRIHRRTVHYLETLATRKTGGCPKCAFGGNGRKATT